MTKFIIFLLLTATALANPKLLEIKELARQQEAELTAANLTVNQLNSRLANIQDSLHQAKLATESYKKKVDELTDNYNKLEIRVSKITQERDLLKAEVDKLQSKIYKLKTWIAGAVAALVLMTSFMLLSKFSFIIPFPWNYVGPLLLSGSAFATIWALL